MLRSMTWTGIRFDTYLAWLISSCSWIDVPNDPAPEGLAFCLRVRAGQGVGARYRLELDVTDRPLPRSLGANTSKQPPRHRSHPGRGATAERAVGLFRLAAVGAVLEARTARSSSVLLPLAERSLFRRPSAAPPGRFRFSSPFDVRQILDAQLSCPAAPAFHLGPSGWRRVGPALFPFVIHSLRGWIYEFLRNLAR